MRPVSSLVFAHRARKTEIVIPTMYVALSTVSAVEKPALSMISRDQHPERLGDEAQQKICAKGCVSVFVSGRICNDGLRLGTSRRGESAIEQEAAK